MHNPEIYQPAEFLFLVGIDIGYEQDKPIEKRRFLDNSIYSFPNEGI